MYKFSCNIDQGSICEYILLTMIYTLFERFYQDYKILVIFFDFYFELFEKAKIFHILIVISMEKFIEKISKAKGIRRQANKIVHFRAHFMYIFQN